MKSAVLTGKTLSSLNIPEMKKIIFSLFFAFAVGISTSNFGSLVRYRIPLLPFYVSSLVIIRYMYEKEKVEKRELSYSYYKAITE